ncbi:MAG: S8 family serine peptidase, partial [Microbacterium sp.]
HPQGKQIDVINISLGYYHETPDDEHYDATLGALLVEARALGCAIVCSAGNDSTERPAFPAALWLYPGAPADATEPENAAPHMSVGALNPNDRSVALFSNVGDWVRTYAPGVSVFSTSPGFVGGVQAGSRDDLSHMHGIVGTLPRQSLDPDDWRSGFAIWSGTSFAAPYIAGRLAQAIAADLMHGSLKTPDERSKALREAAVKLEFTPTEFTPR